MCKTIYIYIYILLLLIIIIVIYTNQYNSQYLR